MTILISNTHLWRCSVRMSMASCMYFLEVKTNRRALCIDMLNLSTQLKFQRQGPTRLLQL